MRRWCLLAVLSLLSSCAAPTQGQRAYCAGVGLVTIGAVLGICGEAILQMPDEATNDGGA